MNRLPLLATLCLTVIATSGVYAVEGVGWRDAQGKPIPESDNQKSSKGFGGNVILTADADWEAKWARPEPPQFSTTDDVRLGESIVALVLFVNPASDANGNVRIVCDYLVTRPDGSISQEVKAATCAEGRLEGNPLNVRLVKHLIGFTGEASDLEGTWSIRVRLTDTVRAATVDLLAKFDYSKTARKN